MFSASSGITDVSFSVGDAWVAVILNKGGQSYRRLMFSDSGKITYQRFANNAWTPIWTN